MAEEFSETCECGKELVCATEEEFDEHPDREPGYDEDGQWRCPDCREEDSESEDGWSEECNQCNIVLDESTGREWIDQLGCLCERCYEFRKGDFPEKKEEKEETVEEELTRLKATDPAAHAALLDRLKQILKAHGH